MYIVIGGGISGIAAAIKLKEALGADARVVLIEKSPRLGGKIKSVTLAGKEVEVGPDSFLTRSDAAIDLIGKLGVSEQLVRPKKFGASIYARGRLHSVPDGMMLGVPISIGPFVKSASMLSPIGRLRAAADLFLPKTVLGNDATISHLVAARFGHEVDDVLVDPMVGGINAGSTRILGLASVAPQFLSAYTSSNHRSLARTMIAVSPAKTPSTPAPIPFASLGGGLQALIEAAESFMNRAGIEILCDCEVQDIARLGDGFEISTLQRKAGQAERMTSLEVKGVVVALPAGDAAKVLRGICPSASAKLANIEYADVAMTVMRYSKSAFRKVLTGSGVLVPRKVGRLTTAVTFASQKWAHLELADSELLRVSVGRFGDDRFAAFSDKQLQNLIEGELSEILGTTKDASEAVTWRWEAALPQYRPFHKDLVASIRGELASCGPIQLCGAAMDGVGIPACIDSGTRAAEQLFEPGSATQA